MPYKDVNKRRNYHNEYIKNRRKTDPEFKKRTNAHTRNAYVKLKIEVFNHYCKGNVRCQCPKCDVSEIKFLTIHHINNDGAKHRKEINTNGGTGYYIWLKRNNFPDGYQVLCYNCNCGKDRNGVCHY